MSNVYLVGFMGCGKSTVGRLLAGRLGRRFADADALIEKRAGRAVPDIFRKEREKGFRSIERRVVRELSRRRGLVVALGGGAFLDASSRRALRSSGTSYYLRCSEAVLIARLRRAARPLLDGRPRAARIRSLLRRRRRLYEKADVTVSVTNKSAASAAREIARRTLRTGRR